MMNASHDTIVAQATAPGRSSIGVVRVSGPLVKQIAKSLLGFLPKARCATYTSFKDDSLNVIDVGLALYFPGPNSFTGEDILELQGHGGQIVLTQLLQRIVQLGARIARAGEFSERAFLNDKMDLVQAEAIADLIDSESIEAAKSALRSLQGEFSKKIQSLVQSLIDLRMFVEAAIDFPDEEIDFLSDGKIQTKLEKIIENLEKIQHSAKQGALLKEGIYVVIAGKPNVGKSSLLNCLTGKDSAIVTDIPGTTRDVMREHINVDGLPLHIIDTAGLRDSGDIVEQEGIKRAKKEIEKADIILWLFDCREINIENIKQQSMLFQQQEPELKDFLSSKKVTFIRNKIDLLNEKSSIQQTEKNLLISLSAKNQEGIDLLREHIKNCAGFQTTESSQIIARFRHLEALKTAHHFLLNGLKQLMDYRAGDLLAEDLRQAQKALDEITGKFTTEDLLSKIFSSFCIGK